MIATKPGIPQALTLSVLVALAAGRTGSPAAWAQGNPATITETLILTASDGDLNDFFGVAVDLSGDYAAVGATGDDAVGFEAGAVYVYERDLEDPAAWNEVAKLTASDGRGGDQFGTRVALDGPTLVVGAPFVRATTDSGAAYVFERDPVDGSWDEVAKLVPSDRGANDRFGIAVTVDGGRVAVGSVDDELGPSAGAVYLFGRDQGGPGAWGQVTKITAPGGAAGDYFGNGVSLSGDLLAVGKPQGQPLGPAVGPGAVHLFREDPIDPALWVEEALLLASDGDFGNLFGYSVALDGNRVVAGAPAEDGRGSDAGAAYVYERDFGGPDAWGEIRKISAFDGEPNDSFGYAVDLEGDRAVVGAFLSDGAGNNRGSAHVFVRDFNRDGKELWRQEAKLVASDPQSGDSLGVSVAWSGNDVLVGTELAEAAYLYDLSFFFEPTPSCVLFDGYCDRLNLVSDFLTITGEWENWDCEGANQAVSGYPLPDATQRVFCRDPGCPLGAIWLHVIHVNRSTWDLWRADGGPPPYQIRDNAPVTILDTSCEEALGAFGGVAVPAGRSSWQVRR